jgi:hypothetical protein
MKQIYVTALVIGSLAIAGCSGGEEANNSSVEAPAAALQAGEYEISATVDSMRSTDGQTPATIMKAGAPAATTRACVAADGAVNPAAVAEAGETCTAGDNYMRNGRMSLQFRCKRAGKGDVAHLVDGKFTKDSFEGEVITTSSFSGPGDFEARRTVKATRVGECAAKAG